jgi:NADPH:quinone reductase-like Zn-dependent oxidoreductase
MYPGAPKPPFAPGYEAAGVVDALGPGAPGLKIGDRVVVPTNFGGYADTLLAAPDACFPIPAGKGFEAAAALTVNYLTAYEALIHQGGLQKGQRVLVHGAAGGVGIAAVQVAKIFDAEIYGTASRSKHDALKKYGVRCIDYRTEDFEARIKADTHGQGVHVALDPVGGVSFKKSYRSLAKTGKVILYGFSAAATGEKRNLLKLGWEWLRTPSFSAFDLMMDNRGVIGLHLGRMTEQKEVLSAGMRQLVAWWSEGRIEPMVGATFPAELAGKAHEYIQSRQNVGKVVLTWP